MLLEIKEAKRLPMASALQVGSDFDAERQIQDRAQQRRDRIENDDRVGEGSGWNAAKAAEKRVRPAAHRRPCGQGLMCDRAEQRDRDQAMNDQKRGRQDALPSFNPACSLEKLHGCERLGRPRPEAIEGELRLLDRFNIHQDIPLKV